MANVAVVYALRRLFSPTALKLYVCTLCLWGIGQLVWVSKVFENLSQAGVARSMQFSLSAFLNTELVVQLVLVAAVLAVFSLFVDLVSSSRVRAFI
jgi:hypothetical protein